MQPYFFPYIGHFSLINKCDKWVVFDVTKYRKKSWMSRNIVTHPYEGETYISLPVHADSKTLTKDAKIVDFQKAREDIRWKLYHYRKAPYYKDVIDLVNRSVSCDSLVQCNLNGLKNVCEYVGIPFDYSICSAMNFNFPENMKAGDWAPFICKEMGATEYINPSSGEMLFEPEDFGDIKLTFHDGEESLSIIDVMMWQSPDEIRERIEQQSA